jgi:hypothetical protein
LKRKQQLSAAALACALGATTTNAQVKAFGNVETPQDGPDWQLRFQIQLLFPEKK